MNRKFCLGVTTLLLAAASLPSASLAQEPAAQPGWQVDWGDNYCSLIRHTAGSGSKLFAFRRIPGAGPVELVTLDPQGVRTERREVQVVFQPSGDRVEATIGRIFDSEGRVGTEIRARGELFDRFTASTSLEVTDGRRRLFQMSYPPAAEAVAALRSCEDDALRGWGIDPALVAAQRTRPQLIRGGPSWSDYPQTAYREHRQGTVLLRLIIDPGGRVADCAVAVSSGSADLDRQSCAVYRSRGRFEPATGADGAPIQGLYITRVSWSLPG